jgi:hypothetical protein
MSEFPEPFVRTDKAKARASAREQRQPPVTATAQGADWPLVLYLAVDGGNYPLSGSASASRLLSP